MRADKEPKCVVIHIIHAFYWRDQGIVYPSACCAGLNWKWHREHNFSIIINVVEAIEGVIPSVTWTSEAQIKMIIIFIFIKVHS